MNIINTLDTTLGDAPGYLQILQGLYDLVPLILFLIGIIILQKTLYNKMVKGCYTLFAGGTIMVFAAGFFKALHKVLLGCGIEYSILSDQFTTTQSVGFFLTFLGIVGMFTFHNKNYTKVGCSTLGILVVLAATEFTSKMPFIILMMIGAAGFLGTLIYISLRIKSIPATILNIIALIAMFGMGYLSTKTSFEKAWIQISVNIIYQGSFLISTILLKKKGLGNEDSLSKKLMKE